MKGKGLLILGIFIVVFMVGGVSANEEVNFGAFLEDYTTYNTNCIKDIQSNYNGGNKIDVENICFIWIEDFGSSFPYFNPPATISNTGEVTLKYNGKNYRVPKVLLSGNHAKIDEWRKKQG